MFKKILFLVCIGLYLVGCGTNNSTTMKNSETIVTVERGAILGASVIDASGEVASQIANTNQYQFENDINYPIQVFGGFIDIDNDGIKNNDDIDLDINLSTYSGNTITLLTTLIENNNTALDRLSEKLFISKSELLQLPSQNKKIALLSNLLYKKNKLEGKFEVEDDLKMEFLGFDFSKYKDNSTQEFLQIHEKEIFQEINMVKNLQSNIVTYNGNDLTLKVIQNQKSAYISPQCYTKTEDDSGKIHNPCYSCHIDSSEPNYINDYDLQESYAFSENSRVNPFTNLFKDRTALVGQISDEAILNYINQDNYKDLNGTIILSNKLKFALPKEWDFPYDGTKDGKWDGYIPDCYFQFDDEGFDKDSKGNYTGWRAFGYNPFLGTFWPTNGSTDDVLIRLPSSMMLDSNGSFSKEVYKINLAIVESMIKKEDITIEEVKESKYGVDLDNNGILNTTNKIVYHWNEPDGFSQYPKIIYKNYYVGMAKLELEKNNLHISPGLYPNGTEFLHSVRYIGTANNTISMAPRMKELRYAKKTAWNNYGKLQNAASAEVKEKDAFPERLRTINGNMEYGLQTGFGWIYQGFIEDKSGDLRPQNYEETLSCIGCHSGIGAITDSTFAFARKENSHNFGWYHWSQKSLVGMKDRILSNGKGEYAFYLENNKAGDEFRGNQEVKNKFFNIDGTLIENEVAKVKTDITYLIYPSKERALELNKAYKIIVDEQSYIYGRDAHIKELNGTVYQEVDIDKSTKIVPIKLKN